MTVVESQAMNMSMKPPPGAAPVALEEVGAQFIAPSATFTGTVLAWADEEVVARVAGRVLQMNVYPGESVLPGQLLVELDSQELQLRTLAAQAAVTEAEYRSQAAHRHHQRGELELKSIDQDLEAARLGVSQAQAESESAAADLTYRKAEYQRSRQLYEAGGIAQEELQRSRSQLVEAESAQRVRSLEMAKARANLNKAQQSRAMQELEAQVFRDESRALAAGRQKNQAESALAETVQGYTRLTALHAGTVVERKVSPGTLVQPGMVLLRLKSTHKLRLQARVPQDYSGQIARGARVQVEVPGRRESLEAQLTADFLETDAATRTFTVEAVVSGSSGLRVGSFVPMQIALASRGRRLTIPLSALQHDLESQPFVWVAVSQTKPAGEKDKAYYTCVMHPEIRESKPGKCPKCQMPLQLSDKAGGLRAAKRLVQLGGTQSGRVAVASGLSPGDRVVVAGSSSLRDGMALVEVKWSDQGPVDLPPPPGDHPMEGMDHGAEAEDYCSPTPGAKP
jgi:multidrug efflux pump subunit AcrA (membrane-fusion protein)